VPRLFLSAGDTSGDQHASRLVVRLRGRLPGLEVEGLGGPELAAAGCALVADLVSRHAIFGLGGALKAMPELFGVLRRAAGVLDSRRPDAVILVDYPGLNLYVARMAHRRGIPVLYFVAPQFWAWAPWRARRLARVVDEAYVILPFEEAFWRDAGLDAHYVGHPLLDELPRDDAGLAALRDPAISERPRPVALLPGSRPREVAMLMPMMLAAAARLAERHPDASFHAAHVSPALLERMVGLAHAAGVPLSAHGGRVRAVMASCRCAIVGSGTATLETGMLGTPLVLLYRMPPVEAVLAANLIVPPWAGQINLLAGRKLHPEVLQVGDDPAALVEAVEPLLSDGEAWRAQKRELAELRERLHAGAAGAGAIEAAARRIAQRLGAAART